MKFKKTLAFLTIATTSIVPLSLMSCSWSVIGKKSTGQDAKVGSNSITYGTSTTDSKTYLVKLNARWLSTINVPGRNAHFQNIIWGNSKTQAGAFWIDGKPATTKFAKFATAGTTKGFPYSVVGSLPYLYTYQFKVKVTQSNPYFTMATRFDPSPDWFGGVSGLNLYKQGNGWLTNYHYLMPVYSAAVRDGRFTGLTGQGDIVKNKTMNTDLNTKGKPFGTINIVPETN